MRLFHGHANRIIFFGLFRMRKRYLRAYNLQERFPAEIDGHLIAEKTIELRRVHIELAVGVPGPVGNHQVHVVFRVAEVVSRAAGKLQVDGVINPLVPTVERTVDVRHSGDAFVYILIREREHVIVEPMRTHRFAVIAGNVGDATTSVRAAGTRIGGSRVDGGPSRQRPRIVVVIELAGVEVGASEAVVLRAMMAIVLVGGEGMPPEVVGAVLGYVERQSIMIAEQDRHAVARDDQLWRNRSPEGPERV
jgi:hypothetical protein